MLPVLVTVQQAEDMLSEVCACELMRTHCCQEQPQMLQPLPRTCLRMQSNDCQEQAINDLLPELAAPACCSHSLGRCSWCEDS